MPLEYAERLENVEFTVARRPSRAELRSAGVRRGTLYGLYEGIPLTRRGSHYGLVPPDKVTIYWEPIVRDYPEEEALGEQVRKTVYHEIAHYFGIGEAELRRTSVE